MKNFGKAENTIIQITYCSLYSSKKYVRIFEWLVKHRKQLYSK